MKSYMLAIPISDRAVKKQSLTQIQNLNNLGSTRVPIARYQVLRASRQLDLRNMIFFHHIYARWWPSWLCETDVNTNV